MTSDKILYQSRPSWLNYHCLYAVGALLFFSGISNGAFVGGFVSCLFIAGFAALLRLRYEFMITDNSIIMRQGLIAKNINEMKIRHIRSLLVRQNVVERILGIGTIVLISAADGVSNVAFKGVSGPHELKERLSKMI